MVKTLTEWRLEKDMTKSELARRAGVARKTLSLQERGLKQIRLETAQKIADALGLDDITQIIWSGGLSNTNRGSNALRGAFRTRCNEPPPVYSLRWWRFKRDLSVESLAKKATISISTIERIETGYNSGSVHQQTARQLVDALGLLDIHEIRWPHGVTGQGCIPGVNNIGVHADATTKPKSNSETCSDCFMQKSNTGQCGCDW